MVCVVTVVRAHVLQCESGMREYNLNRTGLRDVESEPNLSDHNYGFYKPFARDKYNLPYAHIK